MLNALQASDFVMTPLSEDQGAITRFFSGSQAQNMGKAPRLLWALIGSQILCWMAYLKTVNWLDFSAGVAGDGLTEEVFRLQGLRKRMGQETIRGLRAMRQVPGRRHISTALPRFLGRLQPQSPAPQQTRLGMLPMTAAVARTVTGQQQGLSWSCCKPQAIMTRAGPPSHSSSSCSKRVSVQVLQTVRELGRSLLIRGTLAQVRQGR